MQIIKTIRDSDIGSDIPAPTGYEERSAARAVVFDSENNVALLHATKKSYHKLPGGGIEEGENIETALRRELLEEIGCSVNNIRELGIIEEYRNDFKLHQISHCFIANLVGRKGEPKLEPDEIADGFQPEWMSLETAIKTLENEANIKHYEGKFIRLRDLTFLRAMKGIKTILVDAVDGFVVETESGFQVFKEMHNLLETFSNRKIILTGANDEQFKKFGLNKMPYEVFTLKHNPEKTDPSYYRKMLEHFGLNKNDVVYFEHNPDAVKSAESVGIKSYHYDQNKRNLKALENFLKTSL